MQSVPRSAAACLEGSVPSFPTVRQTPRLPNAFILVLDRAAELGLNATEQALVAQLWRYWWAEGRDPFPSVSVLATRLGLAERQTRRLMAALQAKGVVIARARSRSDGGQTSNAYSLEPLLAAALALDGRRRQEGMSNLTEGDVTGDRGPLTPLTGEETRLNGRDQKEALEPKEDALPPAEPFQGSARPQCAANELVEAFPADDLAVGAQSRPSWWNDMLAALERRGCLNTDLIAEAGATEEGDVLTIVVRRPVFEVVKRMSWMIRQAAAEIAGREIRVTLHT